MFLERICIRCPKSFLSSFNHRFLQLQLQSRPYQEYHPKWLSTFCPFSPCIFQSIFGSEPSFSEHRVRPEDFTKAIEQQPERCVQQLVKLGIQLFLGSKKIPSCLMFPERSQLCLEMRDIFFRNDDKLSKTRGWKRGVFSDDFGPCHPANIRWDDGVKSAEAFQAHPAAVFFSLTWWFGMAQNRPQNGWFDTKTAQGWVGPLVPEEVGPHLFDLLTLTLGDSILLDTGS